MTAVDVSAFGVEDSRISKANPDGSELHVVTVPAAMSRRERRRKAAAAGGIGAAVSAGAGKALKLKRVPLIASAAISGAGSAAQSLVGTKPPKK